MRARQLSINDQSVGADEEFTLDERGSVIGHRRGVATGSDASIPAANIDSVTTVLLDATRNKSYIARVKANGAASRELRIHDTDNRIRVVIGGVTPTYSAAGNVEFYAASTGRDTYSFDAWNRLRCATSSSNPSASAVNYTFDAYNLLVKREIGGKTREFFYSPSGQLLEEYEGFTLVRQYVWSPEGRIVACDISDGGPGGAIRLLPIYDVEGSVVALANNSGTVVERYKYDHLGNVTFMNQEFVDHATQVSEFEWNILFRGDWRDETTGLYFSDGLAYHSKLGAALQSQGVLNHGPTEGITDLGEVNIRKSHGRETHSDSQAGEKQLLGWRRRDLWQKITDPIDQVVSGFANAITFGGTNAAREWLYGDIATINHEGVLHRAGSFVGIGYSVALGFAGAGAAAGFARSAVKAWTVAGDVAGLYQSGRAAANGQFSALDFVGFAPTIGWASGTMRRVWSAVKARRTGGFAMGMGVPKNADFRRRDELLDEVLEIATTEPLLKRARKLDFGDDVIEALPDRVRQLKIGEIPTGGWADTEQFLIGRFSLLSSRKQRIRHELGHILDEISAPGLIERSSGDPSFGFRDFYKAERKAYFLQYGWNPVPLTAYNAALQSHPVVTLLLTAGFAGGVYYTSLPVWRSFFDWLASE